LHRPRPVARAHRRRFGGHPLGRRHEARRQQHPHLVEPEIAPEPAPIIAAAPSFLDLALAEHATAPRAEPQADRGDALGGDVHSIVDALHRKARGQAVESAEPPQIPLFDEPVDHQPARPLRLTASSAGNRRRWSRRDA